MRRTRYVRWGLYLLNFLFFLQWSLAMYFNAAFLSARGIPTAYIGFVFAASSSLGALLLLSAPFILERIGNYRMFARTMLILGIGAFILAFTYNPVTITALFIAITSVFFLLAYSLDMFLEAATPVEEATGGVRAIFLTMANSAIAIAPFIAGKMLITGEFGYLYLAMALMTLPILFVANRVLKRFTIPPIIRIEWQNAIRTILRARNLRNIFVVQFLLRFFFAIMVVYLPLLLTDHIGFTLSQMGLILSIMLVPFVLIEIPLGRLADTKWGEKEALITGFCILIIPTALLSFLSAPLVPLWAAVLFATRVGAAAVDVMSETYFFKQVDGDDTSVVSAFRILYPLAFVAAPLLAAVFLFFFPLQMLFAALAAVMLLGLPAAFAIQDTR
jgi:MFS family permease